MTVKPINPVVEKEAKRLVAYHRQSEPDVTKVFWFPDEQEVRLLELTEEVPPWTEEEAHPFYFRASAEDDLPLPSALVMMRPDEVGKVRLPPSWGRLEDAVEL